MRRQRSFTLIELLVTVAIVAVLAAVSWFAYTRIFARSAATEAVVSVNAIREAEKMHKAETGSFVAANNTSEINALLDLGIAPRYYEYRVCNVTDDDFIVIARRIGADIDSGSAESDLDMIVMNGGGVTVPAPQTGSAAGTGIGISIPPSGQPSGGGGGQAAPGASPAPGGGSGGGISSGGGSSSGGGGGGGGDGGVSVAAAEAAVSMSEILSILQNSANGAYFYNLIQSKDISVEYADLGAGINGMYFPTWWLDVARCEVVIDCAENTIYLNTRLPVTYSWTAEAIATTLVHEAMHADYDHNTPAHVAETTARLGVSSAQLSWYLDPVIDDYILGNSQDQEFIAARQGVLLWEEVKGSQQNPQRDYQLALYQMDEVSGSYLYADVVSRYGGYPPYDRLH